jgi:pyridoxamine 5'-phosphate oxidase
VPQDVSEHPFDEASALAEPVQQFDLWFQRVLKAGLVEPNAVTLATTTRDGIPSARIVLLKGYDVRGFVVYTNYESQKGRELLENPRAALVFFWPTLARQVRVVGAVARIDEAESDAYFATRPRGSQIGAWASRQSTVIGARADLDARVAELTARYDGATVPRPPHWGGFRIAPTSVEFWQGRENRLHDRLRYTRRADATWRIERLSP